MTLSRFMQFLTLGFNCQIWEVKGAWLIRRFTIWPHIHFYDVNGVSIITMSTAAYRVKVSKSNSNTNCCCFFFLDFQSKSPNVFTSRKVNTITWRRIRSLISWLTVFLWLWSFPVVTSRDQSKEYIWVGDCPVKDIIFH